VESTGTYHELFAEAAHQHPRPSRRHPVAI
jgi:hypothetical protein